MANSKRGSPIFRNRTCHCSRVGEYNNNTKDCRNNSSFRVNKYIRTIAYVLLLITPTKALANSTTVSSPQSSSQGIVNNNATQIIPSSGTVMRYSQGIQCTTPSISFSPYVVNSHSYQLPRETVTRTPIYNDDTGDIKYFSELPRFEKENFSLNWGASLQFSIPLGRGVDLCHQAVETNIRNQELLYTKSSLEVSLHRLRVCAEQLKLGVRFRPGSPSAVTCEDIEVVVKPNQVLPHTHSIESTNLFLRDAQPYSSLFVPSASLDAVPFWVPSSGSFLSK